MASLMCSKPATPKTLAREVKQTTRRSERDIQREIEALNRQEKQLVLDIKSAAKQNNTKTTNMYAKQLLQLRNTRDRLTGMKTQVASAGMQATTMASQASAMQAMGQTASMMGKVNAAVSPRATQETMAAFQKEMERMNVNSETLDEFLEDAFEDDTMEDEADEIVQQTLLGIGVDLSASMQDAPMGAPAVAKPQGAAAVGSEGEAATPNAAAGEEDARLVAELEARFGALAS